MELLGVQQVLKIISKFGLQAVLHSTSKDLAEFLIFGGSSAAETVK